MVAKKFKQNKSKYHTSAKEVTPTITNDSISYNQLNDSIISKNEKQNRPQLNTKYNHRNKLQVSKEQSKVRLYGKKAQSGYQEKLKKQKISADIEKELPNLNRSIIPGLQFKKGKKGKKFIEDNDTLTWQRILKTVGDKYDEINESKIEKDRRLEEIREIKRQEIEKREQAKSDELEQKKNEIRSKASLARSMRRKNKKELAKKDTTTSKKKSVNFA